MISSAEEARLVLNKWKADSSRVVGFASSATLGFSARVGGTITKSDDIGATFCLASATDFIFFNLPGVIGYGEQQELADSLSQAIANEVQKWTTILFLKYANGERLVLCSMD